MPSFVTVSRAAAILGFASETLRLRVHHNTPFLTVAPGRTQPYGAEELLAIALAHSIEVSTRLPWREAARGVRKTQGARQFLRTVVKDAAQAARLHIVGWSKVADCTSAPAIEWESADLTDITEVVTARTLRTQDRLGIGIVCAFPILAAWQLLQAKATTAGFAVSAAGVVPRKPSCIGADFVEKADPELRARRSCEVLSR